METNMIRPELLFYNLHDDVVAFSTTRHGGCSKGKYAEFNINPYCGDNEDAIIQNRKSLCRLLDIDNDRLIMPHQVHLDKSAHIDESFFLLPKEEKRHILEGVDAVMTNLDDVCIGVSTADCIPILVYDMRTHVVAAIHAGWRGTVQRIVHKTLCDMKDIYGSCPNDMKVQIGPGISVDSFEVGDEVYEEFALAGFNMESISFRKEKWHINLPECNCQQLIDAGVLPTNISVAGICTFKKSDIFFSARKEGINSGRIYTGIMLNKNKKAAR